MDPYASGRPMYGQAPPPGMSTGPVTYPPGGAPVSYPPRGPRTYFGGMQFIYVQDPLSELASCPSLLIRQEPEFMEAMSGCEQPNIYHVFGNSPSGFRYLFKCMEKSNWCSRRCCPSTQRPLDVDIIHCNSMDQLGMGYTTPFATMDKPCKLACYCFCRPEVEIIINSNKQSAGKIKHIWTCCDPTFEVYNASGMLRFKVTGSCCQCALLCPGFVGKTSRGEFDILEGDQVVGKITKEPASFSEVVTDADSYVVNFPLSADAYDKLLLTGLTMMLDYQYFETDADGSKKNKKDVKDAMSIGGKGLKIGLGRLGL